MANHTGAHHVRVDINRASCQMIAAFYSRCMITIFPVGSYAILSLIVFLTRYQILATARPGQQKANPRNFLLWHAIGANTGEQIGSVMAASVLLAIMKGMGYPLLFQKRAEYFPGPFNITRSVQVEFL